MKLVRWTRFSWDLTSLAPVYPSVEAPYQIRQATAEDERAVRAAVTSAFTLDSSWNFLLRDLQDRLEASLDAVFHIKSKNDKEKNAPLCSVVTHGSRIIGASALSIGTDVPSHLLTGPCILNEYRNRGLATALLAQSLTVLREAGVTLAHGVTLQDSAAAHFVYSKFGSVNEPYGREADLLAS